MPDRDDRRDTLPAAPEDAVSDSGAEVSKAKIFWYSPALNAFFGLRAADYQLLLLFLGVYSTENTETAVETVKTALQDEQLAKTAENYPGQTLAKRRLAELTHELLDGRYALFPPRFRKNETYGKNFRPARNLSRQAIPYYTQVLKWLFAEDLPLLEDILRKLRIELTHFQLTLPALPGDAGVPALAEAAAEAVGANALLARVGAYYHDIGKLIRPMYFKENQMGENPHDKTDPRVSTAILTEHTRDGVELARKHRLPEPIIDMIRQHHGDTPVMYFYAKAVKMLGEENVDIRDFRYDGPKPQTAEAAILMLSDTVEAAVRALPDPTQEKISALIRKLVRGKMEDGQLDECTLTFRDIGKICSAFETVLQGVFHERIEYPSVDLSRAQHHSEQKQAEQKTEAKP